MTEKLGTLGIRYLIHECRISYIYKNSAPISPTCSQLPPPSQTHIILPSPPKQRLRRISIPTRQHIMTSPPPRPRTPPNSASSSRRAISIRSTLFIRNTSGAVVHTPVNGREAVTPRRTHRPRSITTGTDKCRNTAVLARRRRGRGRGLGTECLDGVLSGCACSGGGDGCGGVDVGG